MTRSPEPYQSYLLRLRCVDNGGRPIWVYSLESADGTARHEFRTLPALVDFLARQTPPCGARCRGRRSDEQESSASHDAWVD